MLCINCSHPKTSVVNSRTHKNTQQVWRRRRCPACHCTFTTYERVSTNNELQVKHAGKQLKAFDYGKLVNDITNCFGHSPDKAKSATWLAQTVEDQILQSNKLTIASEEIALLAHKALQGFDKLAAKQFAVRHKKAIRKK